MKRLPPPAKAALFVAVLVVAAVVGYVVLIGPQRRQAAELRHEIDDTRTQIALAQTGGGPETDVQPIRVADLFKLSRAMPDRPEIPNVLLELSTISSETGVTFQSITPHDPALVGSYQTIPIDLVFQGHFYDLSDFLFRLRNLVGVHDGKLAAFGRLFAVESVAFEEGDLTFPQVRARLTVEAYVFGDGSTPPAPTPAAAPSTESAPQGTETTTVPSEAGAQPIPAVPPGASAVGA